MWFSMKAFFMTDVENVKAVYGSVADQMRSNLPHQMIMFLIEMLFTIAVSVVS